MMTPDEIIFNLLVQILFDLFQHDMRLWKAYSTTIQACPLKLDFYFYLYNSAST